MPICSIVSGAYLRLCYLHLVDLGVVCGGFRGGMRAALRIRKKSLFMRTVPTMHLKRFSHAGRSRRRRRRAGAAGAPRGTTAGS